MECASLVNQLHNLLLKCIMRNLVCKSELKDCSE